MAQIDHTQAVLDHNALRPYPPFSSSERLLLLYPTEPFVCVFLVFEFVHVSMHL